MVRNESPLHLFSFWLISVTFLSSQLLAIRFGSYARGDAREDSDVDFLVIESEPRDKTSFEALASHPEVDISSTGFFVEKCLKTVAADHGIVLRRTHDVDELAPRRARSTYIRPVYFERVNPAHSHGQIST